MGMDINNIIFAIDSNEGNTALYLIAMDAQTGESEHVGTFRPAYREILREVTGFWNLRYSSQTYSDVSTRSLLERMEQSHDLELAPISTGDVRRLINHVHELRQDLFDSGCSEDEEII